MRFWLISFWSFHLFDLLLWQIQHQLSKQLGEGFCSFFLQFLDSFLAGIAESDGNYFRGVFSFSEFHFLCANQFGVWGHFIATKLPTSFTILALASRSATKVHPNKLNPTRFKLSHLVFRISNPPVLSSMKRHFLVFLGPVWVSQLETRFQKSESWNRKDHL